MASEIRVSDCKLFLSDLIKIISWKFQKVHYIILPRCDHFIIIVIGKLFFYNPLNSYFLLLVVHIAPYSDGS